MQDGRAFGKLLGDAVSSSVQTLFIIGGYMMIFSVIIQSIQITHILDIISQSVAAFTKTRPISPETLQSLTAGILEPHLGIYAFSQMSGLTFMWQMAWISGILGWSGLSVHAQVRSMIQHTDIRLTPFILTRLFHGCLSFALTVVLWKPIVLLQANTVTSSLQTISTTKSHDILQHGFWTFIPLMLVLFFSMIAIMLCISLLLRLIPARQQ